MEKRGGLTNQKPKKKNYTHCQPEKENMMVVAMHKFVVKLILWQKMGSQCTLSLKQYTLCFSMGILREIVYFVNKKQRTYNAKEPSRFQWLNTKIV